MTSRTQRLIGVALLLPITACAACADLRAERLDDAWSIDSGAIRCVIDDRNYVRSLTLPDGRELMAEGGGYWDLVTLPIDSEERNGNYCRFGHHLPAIPRMIRCDDELVHLALVTDETGRDPDNRLHAPLQMEMHYVFTPDLPGFYFFAVLRHSDALPDLVLHQTRHLMRCNPELFTHWRLSEHRAGEMAPWEQFQQAETIADATAQLPDGRIVTKYQMLRPLSDGPVYGITGDGGSLGLWIIEPGQDYHTGGPMKQNLTVQNGALLLNEPTNGHAVGPDTLMPIEGDWGRVYGPWLYLATTGASADEQWQDALARAEVERAAWPYAWCAEAVGEELYPLQRGSVEGRLISGDGEAAAGAWAVLGRPGEDWQSDSDGSRYWARAEDDGRFRIEGIRPAAYELFAWRAGVPGEARAEGVSVEAGAMVTVADLTLPAWGADVIWQVGEADRTAREFRRGDDFRQWNILRFYPDDFLEDVRFVVGESSVYSDWNIAQPGPTVLEDGARVQHPWTVEFSLVRSTDATLTLGIADSSYHPPAGIVVSVNGQELPELALEPGDSAAYRCAAWGRYQVHDVELPVGSLREGVNTITLNLPHRGSWAMYDFVALRTREGVR